MTLIVNIYYVLTTCHHARQFTCMTLCSRQHSKILHPLESPQDCKHDEFHSGN